MLSSSGQVELLFGGVFFVWLVILTTLVLLETNRFRKLTKGTNQKDLMKVLEKFIHDIDKGNKKTDELLKTINLLEKESLHNIQKIGLVRFNPFADTGGNQSFSLALLDGNDSGLIISSLHSRDTTRIYAKPVSVGKGKGYELSEEEKQAVRLARKLK
jgi:deoxyxylulose-5-phosphate synthase